MLGSRIRPIMKNGRMQLKTGILLTPSPKILDVFDRFFGRKNVRLGVNGNAVQKPQVF